MELAGRWIVIGGLVVSVVSGCGSLTPEVQVRPPEERGATGATAVPTLSCQLWEGSDIVLVGDDGATGPGSGDTPTEAITEFSHMEALETGHDVQSSDGEWTRLDEDGQVIYRFRLTEVGTTWYVSGLDRCFEGP